MAYHQIQYAAVILIMMIVGATARECSCRCDEGEYEISYWRAALCGGLAAVAAPVVLTAAGFTATGVAAGSVAAAAQATVGKVAAGSFFATLQSAGATGLGYKAIAKIAVTAGSLCGVTYKERNRWNEDDKKEFWPDALRVFGAAVAEPMVEAIEKAAGLVYNASSGIAAPAGSLFGSTYKKCDCCDYGDKIK